MKRVVVTGIGINCCLGNDQESVIAALKQGRSGLKFKQEYQDLGFRSQVAGNVVGLDLESLINRKIRRYMGKAAAFSYLAMQQAIEDSGLTEAQVSHDRTGLIAGSVTGSSESQVAAADLLREKGVRQVGPFMVTRIMSSSVSGCLCTAFQIKGLNYAISSACATSSHCIGNAMEQIQWGKQDIIFAGGGCEEHWTQTMLFESMSTLSSKYNDTPEKASRPYDANRDGFVVSEGAGIIVLEELEHALKRGAPIYAEIVGYGATSDGVNMVAPSGEGAVRCMKKAMETVNADLNYINTHGTSTPTGDIAELKAIREAFGEELPPLSSTKSLTGHSLGAAGVHEAIYCLLMMKHQFVAASANIENMDEGAKTFPIVTECQEPVPLNVVLSNSFGFGGTNATLVFQRFQEDMPATGSK
ncbi:beta-ketoacyl-ACP synthase I [Deltaproteobacteria bacterium TL4]